MPEETNLAYSPGFYEALDDIGEVSRVHLAPCAGRGGCRWAKSRKSVQFGNDMSFLN
jgi:hypothetical protein